MKQEKPFKIRAFWTVWDSSGLIIEVPDLEQAFEVSTPTAGRCCELPGKSRAALKRRRYSLIT